MQIFDVIIFFKLRTIQQKTVEPTYLCPLGARKLAEGKGHETIFFQNAGSQLCFRLLFFLFWWLFKFNFLRVVHLLWCSSWCAGLDKLKSCLPKVMICQVFVKKFRRYGQHQLCNSNVFVEVCKTYEQKRQGTSEENWKTGQRGEERKW